MSAMPILLAILCLMAIAYRYYSAFLAAKVACLDGGRQTPAYRFNDGQNYHPTSKWVLFGHHFAAISGAGPLIGPVLAAQFGYLPGLLWIVIGVCLAGAVQDFLALAASMRYDGKSIAQIAWQELGKTAGTAAMAAIIFILVIAMAGLGKVVVKALGGEEVKYPAGSALRWDPGHPIVATPGSDLYSIPAGTTMTWNDGKSSMTFTEQFVLKCPTGLKLGETSATIPANAARIVPGSSWGTFTIACTIPIALFTGLYMYRLRKGHVIEASLIGAALTLFATMAGGWVSQSSFGQLFNLQDKTVLLCMAGYGFIASVLPVWVLLCPRDYLSSFLKIGTIFVLVGGVLIANPTLHAPALNPVFFGGGPTVTGQVFPFLFITIMCGAISGFHSLVSSGTTPKMIKRETDARTIGYGAMLIEGLVGVVAMIAAAALPTNDYYAMNTDLAKVPVYQDRILQVGGAGGIEHMAVPQDNLPRYESLTHESLRGRTGGAVTLAVGMADIFDKALARFTTGSESVLQAMWKYWYHFAIMFEALFILTTIDTGTRVGRFVLQELLGRIWPRFGQTGWLPSTLLSTALMVGGWAYFINANSMAAIWPMFGVSNQMLAVIALSIISVWLAKEGRGRYLWVTVIPAAVVLTTTSTAAIEMLFGQYRTVTLQLANTKPNYTLLSNSVIQGLLIIAILTCTLIVIFASARRILYPEVESDRTGGFPIDALPSTTDVGD
jgi:carbon starvation protein